MASATRLVTMITSFCLLQAAPQAFARQPDMQALLAPQLCMQLGGPLPCHMAQPGPWTYKTGDATFPSEAAAYAHMLDIYGPASIFALAYRWGKVNPNPGTPEQMRSFETMGWKMYFRECSGQIDAPCEEFPRFTGYQRVRDVACPAGHVFSSDAASPYCIPGDAARAFTQAATSPVAAGARLTTSAGARPGLPR